MSFSLEKLISPAFMKLSNVYNAGKLIGGLAAFYVIYKAGRIYLIRKKYDHIPGPPAKGYNKQILSNLNDIHKLI